MASVRDVLVSVNALLDQLDALGDDGRFDPTQTEFFSRHRIALDASRQRFGDAHTDDGETQPGFAAIVTEADTATGGGRLLQPDDASIELFGRGVAGVIARLDHAAAQLPKTLSTMRDGAGG